MAKEANYRILRLDPWLGPYAGEIDRRMRRYRAARRALLGGKRTLSAFADAHLFFGFHPEDGGWVYREWAPGADEVFLFGDFNDWNRTSHPLCKRDGYWELRVPGDLPHGAKVRIRIRAKEKCFERIPLYCRRVVKSPLQTYDGVIWCPPEPFPWSDAGFEPKQPLMVYECHIGMSGEEERISTFREFAETVLPHVRRLGYNALQVMAVMEHPYYASFGYQVSNFFAVSSRFGTPEEFKALVNTAHGMGIAVIMDLVHSHVTRNTDEGLAEFDGTDSQFCHGGSRGDHPAWGTRLLDYGKPEVRRFLLSNIKYWLTEYHLDGFRFDGVTSMLYGHHGLGVVFDGYEKYFSPETDPDAVVYLQLAAALCREIAPGCVLIAEDMSGMPGMCLPIADGGIGFDYRLGMGLPDYWIKILREQRDEEWSMGALWYELSTRRPGEKVIGYCESHDQALVGDKTIMFRLADQEMYWHMEKRAESEVIDRAMALHKMIRLITCAAGGDGYLNFMGNEFGHPEWIDFPREGNGWSYQFARRRWSLARNPALKYEFLQEFDVAMIALLSAPPLLGCPARLIHLSEEDRMLVFSRGEFLFLFNFHPGKRCLYPLENALGYSLVLHSAWRRFGGALDEEDHRAVLRGGSVAVDRRTAVVLALR